MKDVGQSQERNKDYQKQFSREKLLQTLINSGKPVIFDVGAHHGESVKYLTAIFPESRIYSFEPDPDSFAILSASAREGLSCFNLALSDSDGLATFYRNSISHTNSLFKVNLSSKDSIGLANANRNHDSKYYEGFNDKIKVPTIRLDNFVEQHSIESIDLLKIDVQGAETGVLAGGSAFLSNVGVIVLEISFFDYYEQQTSFMDVERILQPFGFRLFNISEVSQNPMNGRTDWAEVIYLNQGYRRGIAA